LQGQVSLLVDNLVNMFTGDDIGSVEEKCREESDKDCDNDKQFQPNALHGAPLFIHSCWEIEAWSIMKHIIIYHI
jgi:hypothetical protein